MASILDSMTATALEELERKPRPIHVRNEPQDWSPDYSLPIRAPHAFPDDHPTEAVMAVLEAMRHQIAFLNKTLDSIEALVRVQSIVIEESAA